MSTSFYIKENYCKHCNRFDEIPVGLHRANSAFIFKSYKHLVSRKLWLEYIKIHNINVYNEYGDFISYWDFVVLTGFLPKRIRSESYLKYENDPDGFYFDYHQK